MTDDTGRVREGGRTPGSAPNPGTASYASEIPTVSTGTVFELLANCHCRAVLDYLENTDDGRASISELAAYVSQHACAGTSLDQVTIRLHHSALPKLADAGLNHYDPETKTVQYIGHPLVEDCLDLVDGQ